MPLSSCCIAIVLIKKTVVVLYNDGQFVHIVTLSSTISIVMWNTHQHHTPSGLCDT